MKFNLGGKSSDDLDIALLNTPKPLQAGVSNKVINVDGRVGGYDYGGDLKPLNFQLNCEFKNATSESGLQNKIRSLADHLFDDDGKPQQHELSFSDEPDKYWTVRYSAGRSKMVDRVIGGTVGRFTLEFVAVDPRAHESEEIITTNITTSGQSVSVDNSGTVKTPLRIEITNNGSNTINGFTIKKEV